MNSLLFGLAYGLSVTLVTELSVAALLRVRGWDLVLIGLVNCLTNPVVNLIYAWSLLKKGADIRFAINDLEVLRFHDDGAQYGPLLGGGRVGLRQLAPMIGEYANLRVYTV